MVTRHVPTVKAFGVRVRNQERARGAMQDRDRPLSIGVDRLPEFETAKSPSRQVH